MKNAILVRKLRDIDNSEKTIANWRIILNEIKHMWCEFSTECNWIIAEDISRY
jgi:hypothetical protein